jgi:hypothetical protein
LSKADLTLGSEYVIYKNIKTELNNLISFFGYLGSDFVTK